MPNASAVATAPVAPAAVDDVGAGARLAWWRPALWSMVLLAAGAAGCLFVTDATWSVALHLVIIGAVIRWGGMRGDELGLSIHNARRSLLAAIGIAVACAAVVAVGVGIAVARAGAGAPVAADPNADDTTVWFRVLVEIPFATALFEEVLFRGWLLAAWRRVTSVRWAVVASSVVFGLWHVVPEHLRVGGSWWAVLPAVLATAAAGALVFCPLRLRTGSLLAPVLVHWFVNAGVVLVVAAVAA